VFLVPHLAWLTARSRLLVASWRAFSIDMGGRLCKLERRWVKWNHNGNGDNDRSQLEASHQSSMHARFASHFGVLLRKMHYDWMSQWPGSSFFWEIIRRSYVKRKTFVFYPLYAMILCLACNHIPISMPFSEQVAAKRSLCSLVLQEDSPTHLTGFTPHQFIAAQWIVAQEKDAFKIIEIPKWYRQSRHPITNPTRRLAQDDPKK
jgi:hypothetical protein